MKFITRLLPAVAFMPVFAFAAFEGIDDFVDDITQLINNTLVPLIFAIAFLVFLWGVVKYFILGGEDNESARKEGKQYMLWGIIGFVIMVSIWGIVNLLAEGLGLTDENIQVIPDTPSGQR